MATKPPTSKKYGLVGTSHITRKPSPWKKSLGLFYITLVNNDEHKNSLEPLMFTTFSYGAKKPIFNILKPIFLWGFNHLKPSSNHPQTNPSHFSMVFGPKVSIFCRTGESSEGKPPIRWLIFSIVSCHRTHRDSWRIGETEL